jgi:hypothetical protein
LRRRIREKHAPVGSNRSAEHHSGRLLARCSGNLDREAVGASR